jgi:hypothetical protein
MKVRERWGDVMDIEDALNVLLDANYDGGSIERIDADVRKMKEVFVRFLQMHITTADQLNLLAGYDRFDKDEK